MKGWWAKAHPTFKMNIHKNHPSESKPRENLPERIGYPTWFSLLFGILATVFGIGSAVCMGMSRGGFPDGWGILGILSLITCWITGGLGALIGFYGTLSDIHGRHAFKALIFCIVVMGIATGAEIVMVSLQPNTGGPGAAGGF